MEKKCLECNEVIKGRVDKKFCSDQCRNSFNNSQNGLSNNYIRNINNVLRKNRRILLQLTPNDKSKVSRNKLSEKGFKFNFYTNTYTTQKGVTYYFCYDYGYLPLENGYFALVLRKEYVE